VPPYSVYNNFMSMRGLFWLLPNSFLATLNYGQGRGARKAHGLAVQPEHLLCDNARGVAPGEMIPSTCRFQAAAFNLGDILTRQLAQTIVRFSGPALPGSVFGIQRRTADNIASFQ